MVGQSGKPYALKSALLVGVAVRHILAAIPPPAQEIPISLPRERILRQLIEQPILVCFGEHVVREQFERFVDILTVHNQYPSLLVSHVSPRRYGIGKMTDVKQ
jgi:hypothetical protein